MYPAPEAYPPWAQVRYLPQKYDPVQGKVYSIPPHTQPIFYLKKNLHSSSSWMASVSRCHVYSRAVVFHTLHRRQRDTRLCTLISYRLLRSTITFAPPRESSFNYLCHSSPPPPSAVAAAAYRAPSRSILTFSHHRIPTCTPVYF